MSPLINEYRQRVLSLTPFSLADVRILGSFGTGNEQKTSDLDPWLVLGSIPTLETLSVLAKKEFHIRQELSEKYGYPNLARHRATIFSREQSLIYEQTFAIRVGIPRKIGAIVSLTGNNQPNDGVFLSEADLIVTLGEYVGLYDRNLLRVCPIPSRKFTRRMVQDLGLFFEGEYVTDKALLDRKIFDKYSGSDEVVFDESNRITKLISEKVPIDKLQSRDLSHKCAFTMEKVIWELSRGYFCRRSFNEWRQMRNRIGGFYPNEIRFLVGEFTRRFGNALPSSELLDSLDRLEKTSAGLTDLEEYYQNHSSWMLKAADISLRASM